MHPTEIPKAVADVVIARRGQLHVFDEITPATSALLVVDMQVAFLDEAIPSSVPTAREIVPNVNRLAGALRDAGGTVAWLQVTCQKSRDGGWPVFYDHMMLPAVAADIIASLTEGAPTHGLWPALDVRDGDLQVLKSRFSPFIPGASDLEPQLRARGIDTVIVAGTLTNVCCEATARDAVQSGFKTIFVSDANATRTDAAHVATLCTIISAFGDVRTTNGTISLLSQAGSASAAE